MIKNIIQTVFHKQPQQYYQLDKGITNQNWYVLVDDIAYIVRIPYQNNSNVVHYTHEFAVLQEIDSLDIDIKPIYYDVTTGIKVAPFIPLKTYDEYNKEDRLIKVAHLMKKLHSLQKSCGFSFHPIERLKQYASQIHTPLYDLSNYNYIIDEVNALPKSYTICHNDWVEGNICFTEEKEYLIDYEYAADNDPLFDVMSFITENKITKLEDRITFYQAYFDQEMDAALQHKLDIWEVFHNLLWCNWAMMMYQQRQEDIFLEIAKDKYYALTQKK